MPIIAVIASGEMGSGVGRRLVENGNTVLTCLENRSNASRERARAAGMVDASISEIVRQADFVLSILPPKDAYSLAELFAKELQAGNRASDATSLIYADCNAVNPVTVKKIAALFSNSSATFIDGSIIGGPPNGTYNPTFYVSADVKDRDALINFEKLRDSGLQITALSGTGAGIGDASALKMSYAGISKGITGLVTTMLLAAHASSPATSEALLKELKGSQPMVLQRIVNAIPPMLPKAYRWVGEMHEIAGFVGEGEGEIYNGIANTYARIEKSIKERDEDVEILENIVQTAKRYLSEQ